MSEELKALVEKIERNAWRMGELWEKYQGKGWPDVEGDLFTKLRDETGPELRASIAGLLAAEPAAEALAAEIKRLAEDMADAACATEAGEFVQRQRIPLHAAIDRLAALAHPAPAGWMPISSAPEDEMVVVFWREDGEGPESERHAFDMLEEGVWRMHYDNYEHYLMIGGPSMGPGPKEQAPYTHYMRIAAAPNAQEPA